MKPLAVRCRSLIKRYGDNIAVNAIDLDVEQGQCFGLLGPNGAGKTTTVEMLEGLHPVDGGSLELFGHSWGDGHDHNMRQRYGAQLQATELADKLKVREVLRLFRSFYDQGHSVPELIEMVDLGEFQEQYFHTLSGGQKQRVAIACALAGAPELLFLDEPTTGLDPRARQRLWAIIENFRESGGTVMLTTHYMEEAAKLCDRIAIMDHGKIIDEGTPRSLVDSLGLVQFVEFETQQTIDLPRLTALAEVESVEQRGLTYRLRIGRDLNALRVVLVDLDQQRVVPVGRSTHQATLDDVFMERTGRALLGPTQTGQGAQASVPRATELAP